MLRFISLDKLFPSLGFCFLLYKMVKDGGEIRFLLFLLAVRFDD